MVQTRKAHIAGQNHPQQKLEDGHGARAALDGQRPLDQLLKAEFLQHGGDRKQPAVSGQVVGFEVMGRGIPDFIRLRNISVKPLMDGAARVGWFALFTIWVTSENRFAKP